MKVKEIGKQWGIAEYEYGVQNIDLSECEDNTTHINRVTWGDIKENEEFECISEEIIRGGVDGIEDDYVIDIYTVICPEEEYTIYVPEWWD